MRLPILSVLLSLVCFIPGRVSGQTDTSLFGSWDLLPGKSTEIDLYGVLSVTIARKGDAVAIVRKFGGAASVPDRNTPSTDFSLSRTFGVY